MKKVHIIVSSILAGAAVLSCTKSELRTETGKNEGGEFEVRAFVSDTKTSIDGYKTSWADGDAITVFHNGTNDGKFSLTDKSSGTFSGNLAAGLQETNNWNAVYPYVDGASLESYPLTYKTNQTQNGLNSTAHLCGEGVPFYSALSGVAKEDTPSFQMHHLTSFLKVHVTNDNAFPIDLKYFEVWNWVGDGSNNIALSGSYTANLSGETPVLTKVAGESFARLDINGGTIAAGESADFYLAVPPCTIPTGAYLTVYLNGGPDKGGCKAEKQLTSDLVLKAGKMKEMQISYKDNLQIQIIGNAVDGGSWNFTEERELKAIAQGVYSWKGYLSKNSFRFVLNRDWEAQFIPVGNDYMIHSVTQELATQFSNAPEDHLYQNILSGTYTVVFDFINNKVDFTLESLDYSFATVTDIYITGDFNGWANPGEEKFTQDGNIFTHTITLEGGKNTNLLLLGDGITDNWTGVLGGDIFMSQSGSINQRYFRNGDEGGYGQMRIADSGTYKITVDIDKHCVSIEPVK